jgi:hypothetical protein
VASGGIPPRVHAIRPLRRPGSCLRGVEQTWRHLGPRLSAAAGCGGALCACVFSHMARECLARAWSQFGADLPAPPLEFTDSLTHASAPHLPQPPRIERAHGTQVGCGRGGVWAEAAVFFAPSVSRCEHVSKGLGQSCFQASQVQRIVSTAKRAGLRHASDTPPAQPVHKNQPGAWARSKLTAVQIGSNGCMRAPF